MPNSTSGLPVSASVKSEVRFSRAGPPIVADVIRHTADEPGRGVTVERRIDVRLGGVVGEQEGVQAVLDVDVLQERAAELVGRLAGRRDRLAGLAPRRGDVGVVVSGVAFNAPSTIWQDQFPDWA